MVFFVPEMEFDRPCNASSFIPSYSDSKYWFLAGRSSNTSGPTCEGSSDDGPAPFRKANFDVVLNNKFSYCLTR